MGHSQTYNALDKSIAATEFVAQVGPAAGADFDFPAESYRHVAPLLVSCSFLAGAAAANRSIALQLTRGAATQILGITDTDITATQAVLVTFGVGISPSEPQSAAYRMVPIVGDLFFSSSDTLSIVVLNIQALDALSNIYSRLNHLVA